MTSRALALGRKSPLMLAVLLMAPTMTYLALDVSWRFDALYPQEYFSSFSFMTALVMLAGAMVYPLQASNGRVLFNVALLFAYLLLLNQLYMHPTAVFAATLAFAFISTRLLHFPKGRVDLRSNYELIDNLLDISGWSSLAAMLISFVFMANQWSHLAMSSLWVAVAVISSFLLHCFACLEILKKRGVALGMLIGGMLLSIVLLLWHQHMPWKYWVLSIQPLSWSCLAGVMSESRLRNRIKQRVEAIYQRPEGAVILTFAGLAFVGTILLSSPYSHRTAITVSWLDAAFTAISAVCVTGLNVVDTPVAFSGIGQFIILLLIQVGGLGIMCISSIALLIIGERLSLSQERSLEGGFASSGSRPEVKGILRQVFLVTFSSELIGAMLLWFHFVFLGEGWLQGLWKGIFTAVSAFCNAGFALNSDSLMSYQDQPLVLTVVALLVLLGGLSPAFVVALPRAWRRRRLELHYKVILAANLLLIPAAMAMFAVIEWGLSLGEMSVGDRIVNAFFQSITLRSAGYNSIDFETLQPAAAISSMIFMFIGGSPGSTAGGIKVTTFMVLLAATIAIVRGRGHPILFQRRIPEVIMMRAVAVTIIGLITGAAASVALLLTHQMPPLVAIFEVVSALGTVGLSMGGTALLDEIGKVLIMICMFVGRVGMITVLLFLAQNQIKERWSVPCEEVSVG